MICTDKFSLCGRSVLYPSRDLIPVLVNLDRDPLHVDTSSRRVLVIKRLLRVREAASLFGDDPCIGVAGLVDVNFLDASLACIDLQVLSEGARGEPSRPTPE